MAAATDPTTLPSEAEIHEAISSIDDPEYPGISIVDLGLLESMRLAADGSVQIGLVPTFSGCPALAVIAADVVEAVEQLDGVTTAVVEWLATPVWTAERVSHDARAVLADSFTVAVQIGRTQTTCPRCGGATEEQSMFGPSRCRSVHRCTACSETVEVLRA